MKTFIWNQEYTVSVANGETLEEAIENLKMSVEKDLEKDIELIKNYNYFWVAESAKEEYIEGRINHRIIDKEEYIEWIKKTPPDHILESNGAICYGHANE
jgi:hypothetical protein